MWLWIVALAVLGMTESSAFADSNSLSLEKFVSLLGKQTGAVVQADVTAESQSLNALTTLKILGIGLQALRADATISEGMNGNGSLEYYSFGKRIFSDSEFLKSDGILKAQAGLAPVEVRVPVLVYPVGPLRLDLDAGVRFQAELNGEILPTLWLSSASNSSVGMRLSGSASGSGFIEGSVAFLALRGGAGGEVDLVDGQEDLLSTFYFNGANPKTQFSTAMTFLKGRFYAFADYFNVLRWNWKRFWNEDLFRQKGYCLSVGEFTCPK